MKGVDSPSLRELAGLSRSESREAVDLFHDAMEELGEPVPDENGARLYLMRAAAQKILDGVGDSEDLLHEIYWHACYSKFPGQQEIFDQFLTVRFGWDGVFEDRAAAESAAKSAADSFLRDHPA